MHRVLIAVVSILVLAEPAWAVRGACRRKPRCRPQPVAVSCCPQPAAAACSQPAPCGSATRAADVEPCYCLKEEIETYPIPGGYESRYLAERHDDGCPPEGDCQAPATIYMTDGPGKTEQECSLGECNNYRQVSKSDRCLESPVAANYKPKFAGQLGRIARIVHTDYLQFDSPTQGWVRAKVFIVHLPEHAVIRPGQPARMLALGYEVETKPSTRPTYSVPRKYVEQCGQNECQFYVNTGGVTYALMTAN
jgi:hypothetical protein